MTSQEYRSFVFLDDHWVLFGAIRNGPFAGRQSQPYLEISDPTNPADAIALELDESVLKHVSSRSTVDMRLVTGAGHEGGSLTENEGVPFVPDPSRGIIATDVYLSHHNQPPDHDGLPRVESYIFVMDVEVMLAKVPSLSDPEQHCVEWKDFRSSAATFHYSSMSEDRYRLFSRDSYASEFRYVSPIQPLLGNPDGPRCFFVYDFNPYRETPDPFASSAQRTLGHMGWAILKARARQQEKLLEG